MTFHKFFFDAPAFSFLPHCTDAGNDAWVPLVQIGKYWSTACFDLSSVFAVGECCHESLPMFEKIQHIGKKFLGEAALYLEKGLF